MDITTFNTRTPYFRDRKLKPPKQLHMSSEVWALLRPLLSELRRYADNLFYKSRLMDSTFEAEDVFQNGLIQLLCTTRQPPAVLEHVRRWAYFAMKFALLKLVDKQVTFSKHWENIGNELYYDTLPDPLSDKEKLLEAAIPKLPANWQAALELRSLGASHEQVGEVLGCTNQASRLYQYGAIQRLRKLLN